MKKLRKNCSRSLSKNEYKRKEKVLNSIYDRNTTLDYFIFKEDSTRIIKSIFSFDYLKIHMEFNTKSYQKITTKYFGIIYL